MPDYVATKDGICETANGKSRVKPGQTVSLSEADYARNAALFVPEPAPVAKAEPAGVWVSPVKAAPIEVGQPVVKMAKPVEPVRHTPKAPEPKPEPSKPAGKVVGGTKAPKRW